MTTTLPFAPSEALDTLLANHVGGTRYMLERGEDNVVITAGSADVIRTLARIRFKQGSAWIRVAETVSEVRRLLGKEVSRDQS